MCVFQRSRLLKVLIVLKVHCLLLLCAKFTSWKHKDQAEQENIKTWYNNQERVGKIGHIWRDFRSFFQLNKHEVAYCWLGSSFYVVLVEEKKFISGNIQIFVDGGEIKTFEVNLKWYNVAILLTAIL